MSAYGKNQQTGAHIHGGEFVRVDLGSRLSGSRCITDERSLAGAARATRGVPVLVCNLGLDLWIWGYRYGYVSMTHYTDPGGTVSMTLYVELGGISRRVLDPVYIQNLILSSKFDKHGVSIYFFVDNQGYRP